MKIKTKKLFGEKHRLQRQQRLANANARAEDAIKRSQAILEADTPRARAFLESKAWWHRIQVLRPEDPCEFYDQRTWYPAVFVQPVDSADWRTESWRVCDAQGKHLRALHIRAPGDQEAWPGLPPTPEMEQRRKQREMKLARLGVPVLVRPDVVEDPDHAVVSAPVAPAEPDDAVAKAFVELDRLVLEGKERAEQLKKAEEHSQSLKRQDTLR
jgi:hypothetical protein